jgi:hypothetical protein
MLSRFGETSPEDWRFDTDAHGKPSVVTSQAGVPPLVFNLSHTHGLVACAVAAQRYAAHLRRPLLGVWNRPDPTAGRRQVQPHMIG